jgi:hypothetical protein
MPRYRVGGPLAQWAAGFSAYLTGQGHPAAAGRLAEAGRRDRHPRQGRPHRCAPADARCRPAGCRVSAAAPGTAAGNQSGIPHRVRARSPTLTRPPAPACAKPPAPSRPPSPTWPSKPTSRPDHHPVTSDTLPAQHDTLAAQQPSHTPQLDSIFNIAALKASCRRVRIPQVPPHCEARLWHQPWRNGPAPIDRRRQRPPPARTFG